MTRTKRHTGYADRLVRKQDQAFKNVVTTATRFVPAMPHGKLGRRFHYWNRVGQAWQVRAIQHFRNKD